VVVLDDLQKEGDMAILIYKGDREITPHIASITDPASVAVQIVENYYAAVEGRALHNVVDRGLGY
jgi:phosphoglycerate dehydrogenase-like enzyme